MGGNSNDQTIGMFLGGALASFVVFLVVRPAITSPMILIGGISGIMLVISLFAQMESFIQIGLSKSLPLIVGGQLIGSVLSGAIIFGEWNKTSQWLFGSLAIVLIIIGAWLANLKDSKSPVENKITTKQYLLILLNVVANVISTVLPKMLQNSIKPKNSLNFMFSITLIQTITGLFFAIIFVSIITKKISFNKFIFKNILSGVVWVTGLVAMLVSSVGTLGLATAFTLSQMNIIVGTLSGIFLLHESKTKRQGIFIAAGIILILVGGIITSTI
jgi:glucose uptake protein